MIILLSQNILVAEKDMQCDAFRVWCDLPVNLPKHENDNSIVWFWARHGIRKNDTYVYYEFLDEDTGELLEFSCRVDMDKYMLKFEYYPKVISVPIQQYKNRIKN